jgi:hypothetical protein
VMKKNTKNKKMTFVGDDQLDIIDNITCYFRFIVNNAWKKKKKKKQKCCFPIYHDY